MYNNTTSSDEELWVRTDKDVESWLLPAVALLVLRVISAIGSAIFIGYAIWQNRWLYFNELYGWNWIALFGYFVIASFKSANHAAGSAPKIFISPLIFKFLQVSVSAIAFQLIGLYWSVVSPSLISSNPVQFIGYNIGLGLVLTELIFSRVQVTFSVAFVCAPTTLIFVLWTWFTNYIFKWDFPFLAIEKYLTFRTKPYPLLPNLALVIFLNIAACLLVYLIAFTRDLIGQRGSGHATKHSVPV